MLKDILEVLRAREERVVLADHAFVVREIATGSDFALTKDDPDMFYRIMVASVFEESGEPALSEADIPALKATARMKLAPLVLAVQRVNGLDVEGDSKKSGSGPA